MSIEVLYPLPPKKNFYTPQNKFMATPLDVRYNSRTVIGVMELCGGKVSELLKQKNFIMGLMERNDYENFDVIVIIIVIAHRLSAHVRAHAHMRRRRSR